MAKAPVLLVEDDAKTAATLRLYLERAGYAVEHVADGADAMAAVRRLSPCLVLLDVMLPNRNGLELCRAIRASSTTPVILLTARSTEEDRLRGLGLGADDYVVKPFSPREVVARVEAVLRRSDDSSTPIACGELLLDRGRHEARLGDEALALTPVEFRILALFARRPGRVYAREEIAEAALCDGEASPRAVDVHVVSLRRKLHDPRAPRIATVYGVGYRLDPAGAGDFVG